LWRVLDKSRGAREEAGSDKVWQGRRFEEGRIGEGLERPFGFALERQVIWGFWAVDVDDDFCLLIRSRCSSGYSILEVLVLSSILIDCW